MPALAVDAAAGGETAHRVQVLGGDVGTGRLEIYRVNGLKAGETLYARVKATTGNLDPLVALLKPDVDLKTLTRQSLDDLVKEVSRDRDPIAATRALFDRYTLAGNDDYQGHYAAALSAKIPADGDYWLAVGSSLVRSSEGPYRLTVGVDAPAVLAGAAESRGPAFVFVEKHVGALQRGIAVVNDELDPKQRLRFYHLEEMAEGQTFYAHIAVTEGGLKPLLTLLDHSDKPVAYANFARTESQAALEYRLPRNAEGYRLRVSGAGSTEQATERRFRPREGLEAPADASAQGKFRLRMGVNAPEVLRGEGETMGREILREPIPVRIGVKLQQITEVDQKAENFGVVATLLLHWRDRRLAFDPDTVTDRFQLYEGDAFSEEMNRRGQPWPQYTIVNQQGNRWVQNRLAVVLPDGEAALLERFSTTLQAPDFDFRDFPFDEQRFFIRVDLLAPKWVFELHEIEGYSEVGDKLGEEEWVITDLTTSLSEGSILTRPVSRFNFELDAKRHVSYYFIRVLLPLIVIISVSWVLFLMKDYAKRVDAAGANLLLFIAFNFAISKDLPRLGYLTFLDTLLISAFLVTALVLIISVYLRRQEMKGREAFVARIDRYVITFYPLTYIMTIGAVTVLFR